MGLCVERSPAMLIGLLGILKAGGAYLPLDPSYPPERLAFMLEDAGAPVLVTHAALLDRLPINSAHIVRLDADWPAIAQQPTTAPAERAAAASPRLRHLHVGLHRHAQGRGGRPRRLCEQARGLATGLRCRERLPVGAAHLQRLRRFDRADGAAADRRRRRGGYQRCDTGAAGAVLAAGDPRPRDLRELRAVLSGIGPSPGTGRAAPGALGAGRRGLHGRVSRRR